MRLRGRRRRSTPRKRDDWSSEQLRRLSWPAQSRVGVRQEHAALAPHHDVTRPSALRVCSCTALRAYRRPWRIRQGEARRPRRHAGGAAQAPPRTADAARQRGGASSLARDELARDQASREAFRRGARRGRPVMPEVTAILVNYNAGGELALALQSIREECAAFAWEAVVVDNASTDGSAAVV